MGLKGRLEDLPLLDMLQIIAFSRKSGYLRIAASPGRGAVMFKEGRVLFSYSWSTLAGLEELVRHPERINPEIIREQIEASLRELGGLREGHFQFELADPNSDDFGGVKIQPFLLPQGLDAQELLLDLAVEIDNERKEATSLLELAFEGDVPPDGTSGGDATEGDLVPPSLALPPSALPAKDTDVPTREAILESAAAAAPVEVATPSRSRRTIVLVDDEAPVREIVGEELQSKGYRVFTASNPATGANLVREKSESGHRVVVVVDLKMPTSSERSFYGGFELIRRVQRHDPHTPVLLMVESISEKAKARAKELGIRRLAYKPTLSKIDPDLYRKDLRQFACEIDGQLAKLREDGTEPSPAGNGRVSSEPSPDEAERMDFLAAMTRKLVEPGGSADVSRLVMQVAARFLERGLLFVVKGDTARGLAGYGIAKTEKDCAEIAHRIAIDITNTEAVAETVRRCAAHRVQNELDSLDDTLYAVIDRLQASEAVLIPLLYNRATLLLLYGDNGKSGDGLGDLSGLELFMAQAGMALENKLLQRKLSTVEPDTPDHGADAGV